MKFLKDTVIYLYTLFIVVMGIVTCAFSFLTAISFRLNEENDLFDYHRENIPLLTLLTLAVFAFCFFVYGKNLGTARKWMIAALVFCAVYCLFMIAMIHGRATNDALILDGIVNQFMEGDFTSYLEKGAYIEGHPYQLGYVLAGQILYVLFGKSRFVIYMILNTVAILYTVYCLYKITWELYEDEKTSRFLAVLSFGLLNLYTLSSFVYNDVWSFGLQAGAVLYHLRYLKRHRVRDEIIAAVFIAIAFIIKSNCLITLIAMVLKLMAQIFTVKKAEDGMESPEKTTTVLMRKNLLLALMLVLLSFGLRRVMYEGYRVAAGSDTVPKGFPSSTYFAMGLDEAEGKYGWYNGTNAALYRDNNADYDATDAASKAMIREKISGFKNNPKYFVKFFALKFLSQWGDPTAVSMRELELTGRHGRTSAIKEYIVYGRGRDVLQTGMNVFHFLLFFLFSIEGVRLLRGRKFSDGEAFLLMMIFGGMVFHMLWEASSRYTLRYVIFLLPFAAHGLRSIMALKKK